MHEADLTANDDRAWVTVKTGLETDALLKLCHDPERLFRVNPYWIFKNIEYITPQCLRLSIDNQANGQLWETDAQVTTLPDGCRIDYWRGLKTSTTLRVVTEPDGTAQLQITEDYTGQPEDVRKQRLNEVDNSLLPWGQALYRSLRSYKRWSWFPLWRWYEKRLWRPATPSARRIMGMLVWVTVAELVIFIALVGMMSGF